ncbi:putative glucuronoxylan glucuronosyltransferase IRX7 [Drosera capensis]
MVSSSSNSSSSSSSPSAYCSHSHPQRRFLSPSLASPPPLAATPPYNNNDSRIDVKVYIYDLPGRYNSDWLSNARCGTHLSLLSSSTFRTLDPDEADFFFVPHCNRVPRNRARQGPDCLRRGTDFHDAAVLEPKPPTTSAPVFTLEDAAVADGVTKVMRRSIVLQTFGVERRRHPCQDVEHVVIPPNVSPESVRKTLERWPMNDRGRGLFAFFRGKMEVHPKNVSGPFYSKAVRTKIWRKYANDRRFHLRRQRSPGCQCEIARSILYLCPLGWAPWSPRLVESVALGCVPVIIADGIRLLFPEAIPWPVISLRVPKDHINCLLGSTLEHMP